MSQNLNSPLKLNDKKTSESNGAKEQPLLKRSRADMVGSSTEPIDSEPEEKRPTFRLQPPTLIHGQAKPVPKAVEEDPTSRCKFLQPPKLSVSSTSGARNEVVQPARTGSTSIVSSGNPFLLVDEEDESPSKTESTSVKDDPEEKKESTGAKESSENGEEEQLPDTTTDQPSSSKTDDQDKQESNEQEKNLFLQGHNDAATIVSSSDGFVFGKKMEERATVSTEGTSNDSGDAGSSVSSSEFVFGQNLAQRAKVSSIPDSSLLFKSTTNNDSATFSSTNGTASADSTNQSEKRSGGLEEDAAAHFAASQNRTIIPEVEVITGEEGERNVLQMQCKLYQFDAKKQNWVERGVGNLHLNDGICMDGGLNFQSRLVMRTHGSLRLLLNTKVWPQMTVEKASKKSVRVSAQTEDGSISVFLISATINDAEQIYRALEYRVLHQKQLEDKNKEDESKEICVNKSSTDDASCSNSQPNNEADPTLPTPADTTVEPCEPVIEPKPQETIPST